MQFVSLHVDDWMAKGKTALILKNEKKKEVNHPQKLQSHYVPIDDVESTYDTN